MGVIEVLLIVVIVAVLFGAFGYGNGAYAWPGGILGVILFVILLWLLFGAAD